MTEGASPHMPSIGVIGAGSWATALVKILSEGPVQIHWWMRAEDQAEQIRSLGRNPKYLSDIDLEISKISPSNDLKAVIENSSLLILALPAAFVAEALATIPSSLLQAKVIFSAVKGMIPQTDDIVTDYLHHHLGVPESGIGVIAGPCHSEEVALERQSYLTLSAFDENRAAEMAHLLNCRYIHTHVIPNDVRGIEYATVMKNIVALAVGITRGMNYGDNFQAVLVANAMQEIRLFLDKAVPAAGRDVNASAYLGDLLVTAYSQFSRNRVFGKMIGKGYTVKSAQVEMNMIAEGYFAVKSLMKQNERIGADLPVCTFVYNILYGQSSPGREIRALEARLK